MKYLKQNPILLVFIFSVMGASATSLQTNLLDICSTVPTTSGANINAECPYNASVQCCYIAAGSTSQYVTQSQSSGTVIIRRNASAMVTILGIRQ